MVLDLEKSSFFRVLYSIVTVHVSLTIKNDANDANGGEEGAAEKPIGWIVLPVARAIVSFDTSLLLFDLSFLLLSSIIILC